MPCRIGAFLGELPGRGVQVAAVHQCVDSQASGVMSVMLVIHSSA